MSQRDEFRRVQGQLSVVFVVLLVLGAASTFLNKWLPFCAVIAYAAIGWFLTASQKNSERYADSLYYLGFLLTLFSLFAATLNEAEATGAIISNLGTGLSTTLAGLALRVIVLQFRDTVSDQEEEAKEALDAAVARLITSFGILDGQVGTLTDRLGSIDQYCASSLEQLTRVTEAAREELTRLPAAASAIVGPAAEQLAHRIRSVDLPADVVVRQVQKVFDGLSQATTAAHTAMEQAAVSMTNQLEAAGQSAIGAGQVAGKALDHFSKSLAEAGASASATKTQLENIGQVGVRLQDAYEQHARIADQFRRSVEGSLEVVEHLKQAAGTVIAIESVAQSLSTRVNKLDGVVSAVGSSSGTLIRTMEDVSKSVGDVKSATVELVTFVNRPQ